MGTFKINRRRTYSSLLILLFILTGCGSTPPAPVEDRSRSVARVKTSKPASGMHTVVRGDTLYGIAFRYSMDYKKLARWNSIRSPYTIYVGQRLRLMPPPVRKSAGKVSSGTVTKATRKPAAKPPAKRSSATAKSTAKTAPAPAKKPAASNPAPARSAKKSDWQWPTNGRIISRFNGSDPGRSGLDLAGKVGQSVRAASSGTVVYSGNGLLGYGELVIIKHSETLLSAYAHNRRRLVQEGDRVRGGQKIAEMGKNDANVAMLHFEVRINGKPVDPLPYLPSS